MTRDEAITVLLNEAWLGTNEERERIEEAVSMAIEALKQGDVLQEIRTEILEQGKDDVCAEKHGCIDEILAIIDKRIGDMK